MLNLDTLLLVQICITLLTTALLVASASYSDSPPELRWWAAGNVALSAGMVLSQLDHLPLLLHAVLSYGVVACGLGLVLRGLRVYCNESLSWTVVLLIGVVAVVVPGYYAVVTPNLSARLCFSGFYFGLLNWLCALVLARHRAWRTAGIAMAGFVLLGLALCMRGAHVLRHGLEADAASLVIRLSALLVPLAQVCITFGLILMVMWRYAERLRRLSTLDALTGALNRAGLEGEGRRMAMRALRAARSLSVIMIDVDHFKAINDSHGHLVGDEALRHLAGVLREELRPRELLARFGGEEFVLLLDGVNLVDALAVAERVRARIAARPLEMAELSLYYTASMGVACSDAHGYDLTRLLAAGDAALYEAKRAGRNQVEAGCAAGDD